MAYTALYRKLRSQRFSDMVGQEHIVKTLKNQIQTGRVSHAYLFCGIRGTGKTSAARILSRAINCAEVRDGEPCNACSVCLDILKERSLNVIEIDAASHTGVENMREIIEECSYSPTSGKYKIYIIDEAHMLSASSFNALLKTLEEPPDHVVFILATTDPHKIPITIHSRCQRFDFKRITPADIAKHISDYAKTENLDITAEAVRYIASVSDGAMRDALNILEQCVSFYAGESITLIHVQELLSAVAPSVFFELTDALYTADTPKILSIIDEAVTNGREISRFIAESLTHFRNVLVCKSAPDSQSVVDASDETVEKYRKQGAKTESAVLINYINTFAELQGKLKIMPNERAMLEVACIRLCNPQTMNSFEALVSRINLLEQYIGGGGLVKTAGAVNEATGGQVAEHKKTPPETGYNLDSDDDLFSQVADNIKFDIEYS